MFIWDLQYLEMGDMLEEIRRRLAMATNELSMLKFLWNGQDPQA